MLVVGVVVGNPVFEVVDDCCDVLEVGLHLDVMTAALVGLTGPNEGRHGSEDPPLPAALPQPQSVLVVVDKDQISQFLVIAPMPSFGVNTGIAKLGKSCLRVVDESWSIIGGVVLYFCGWGVGDHFLGVNYIEKWMIRLWR